MTPQSQRSPGIGYWQGCSLPMDYAASPICYSSWPYSWVNPATAQISGKHDDVGEYDGNGGDYDGNGGGD